MSVYEPDFLGDTSLGNYYFTPEELPEVTVTSPKHQMKVKNMGSSRGAYPESAIVLPEIEITPLNNVTPNISNYYSEFFKNGDYTESGGYLTNRIFGSGKRSKWKEDKVFDPKTNTTTHRFLMVHPWVNRTVYRFDPSKYN